MSTFDSKGESTKGIEAPYFPYKQARSELACDEHDEVIYVSGGNYGRCCRRCGEKIGDWIPHDNLTEGQKHEAIKNRRGIVSSFEEKVEQRAQEIRQERRGNHQEDIPGKDATPQKWQAWFDEVREISGKEVRDDIWEISYEEYLKSKAWLETRKRVLEEKGDECAAQLSVCDGEATLVHHRSYQHAGMEPLWDLMPVCNSCHDALHRQGGYIEVSEDVEVDVDEANVEGASISYDEFFSPPALDDS